ncbi:MAG: hypothetical protein JSS49_07410 [Planctomycetes bacterium]|nr:hypothetical protein [Planctomycetota bacterium]
MRCSRLSTMLVLALLVITGAARAAEPQPEWPPVVDLAPNIKPFPGRKVEYFRHGTKADWGYAKPQQDFFILVHPETPSPKAPVYVCLHSAGHDGKSAYEIGTEGAEGPRGHFLYYPPADCYGLYPDCRANGSVGDWWWGGPQPNEKQQKNLGPEATPTEKRVEDTVNWVLCQYPTDRNRVYLTGISMGGSGSLGFGVPRGNLFASILVHVPAGAAHVEQRMSFPPLEVPVGRKFADPPVVVAYSGVNDGWAKDQATLIKGMHARKYAFVDFWGHSGHDSTKQSIASQNDLAFSYPWLEIRKNEAYPVFTDATSDNKAPWLATDGSEPAGQINAFFRWKNLTDTDSAFSIELRLLTPSEFKSAIVFPSESTADVTLRRLQKFPAATVQDCTWEFTRDGTTVAKGTVQSDAIGLITIPRLAISQTPGILTLKR